MFVRTLTKLLTATLIPAALLLVTASTSSLDAKQIEDTTPQSSQANDSSGQIAFVSDRDGNSEIYLINSDGSGLINLTNNPAEDMSPEWSPDGAKLALASDRSGTSQIYVMDGIRGGEHQLTEIENGAHEPVWSPDGSKIVFRSYYRMPVEGGEQINLELYLINADGANLTKVLEQPGTGGRISWAPDSERFIFDNNPDGEFALYIVDLEGNISSYAPSSAVWDFPGGSEGGWWDITPDWSPNGDQVAFGSTRWQGQNDIYVSTLDGLNVINLTSHIPYSYGPVWSPDGQWVAFNSGGQELYAASAAGDQLTKLADLSSLGTEAEWDWSHDSSFVTFANNSNSGKKDIYVVTSDGNQLINLTDHPAVDNQPTWRPTTFDVGSGLIAYYDADDHVSLISSDGNETRLVTDKGNLTGNFYDHGIKWSPDGRQLAFVRGDYPGSPEEETLFVYDVQSSTLTPLLNVHDLIGFDWSPDSKSLVYSFEGSLWQVDVQSVKTSELVVPERGYPLVEPHWAPGGQYLGFAESVVGEGSGLFAIYSPAEQDYQAYDSSLGQYSWSPDGSSLIYDGIVYVDPGEGLSRLSLPSGVEQLTWPGAGVTDAAPVMTTDGSQIAFLRSASEEEPHFPWVMNSDGSGQRQVASLPVRSVLQSLSWSPDGSMLAIGARTQEETGIFLVDIQSAEPLWLISGHSPAWQPRPAPIQGVDEPACGTWRWKEVSGEDDRIELSPISEDSWEACRQAYRLSNKTDIYSFGGYALELTTRPDNAVVEMVPSADPDNRSYLLPPLNSEIHVTPHDAYSEANVFINGEMSLRSFSIDLSLFLLRSGLALIPGTGCVISEEQLLFTALRTSDIVTTAAELTLEGDFVAAKDELQQVLPEFYEKAGDVLADIGVECGIDLVQAILKKPLTIVKVGVAYLTWVPVVISNYFKHEGQPIRITLTYAEASTISLVSVWRSGMLPLISRS